MSSDVLLTSIPMLKNGSFIGYNARCLRALKAQATLRFIRPKGEGRLAKGRVLSQREPIFCLRGTAGTLACHQRGRVVQHRQFISRRQAE
jgi:hypothetical protein